MDGKEISPWRLNCTFFKAHRGRSVRVYLWVPCASVYVCVHLQSEQWIGTHFVFSPWSAVRWLASGRENFSLFVGKNGTRPHTHSLLAGRFSVACYYDWIKNPLFFLSFSRFSHLLHFIHTLTLDVHVCMYTSTDYLQECRLLRIALSSSAIFFSTNGESFLSLLHFMYT